MSVELLKLNAVSSGYGAVKVLFDIDLEVQPGEIVAVLGSNGAGKTTLLRTIAGLVPATRGETRFADTNINAWDIERRVQAGIALVPEGRMLFSGLTVEENLIMGGYRVARKARAEGLESIYELFPDLAERRRQLGGTLSGGQQQMVAIGRGLMAQPKLLLIDEFSLGLAPTIVESILETLARLHEASAMSVVIVEQDIRVGLYLASRGYVLENGHVALADASAKLLSNPQVREAYLGL